MDGSLHHLADYRNAWRGLQYLRGRRLLRRNLASRAGSRALAHGAGWRGAAHHHWAKREHYDALMGILKQQGGAYGVGVEYAYTMVHHAPQSAQKPQIVPKKAAAH